jgi:hypothetical protein
LNILKVKWRDSGKEIKTNKIVMEIFHELRKFSLERIFVCFSGCAKCMRKSIILVTEMCRWKACCYFYDEYFSYSRKLRFRRCVRKFPRRNQDKCLRFEHREQEEKEKIRKLFPVSFLASTHKMNKLFQEIKTILRLKKMGLMSQLKAPFRWRIHHPCSSSPPNSFDPLFLRMM